MAWQSVVRLIARAVFAYMTQMVVFCFLGLVHYTILRGLRSVFGVIPLCLCMTTMVIFYTVGIVDNFYKFL